MANFQVMQKKRLEKDYRKVSLWDVLTFATVCLCLFLPNAAINRKEEHVAKDLVPPTQPTSPLAERL